MTHDFKMAARLTSIEGGRKKMSETEQCGGNDKKHCSRTFSPNTCVTNRIIKRRKTSLHYHLTTLSTATQHNNTAQKQSQENKQTRKRRRKKKIAEASRENNIK